MKKLLLIFSLSIISLQLNAGIQDGCEIPDAINLHNSSEFVIEANGVKLYPDDAQTFPLNSKGTFVIKQAKDRYQITCPTYDPYGGPISEIHITPHLDFTTIAWLAGNTQQFCPEGLDQVEIHNDTFYKIIVRYILTKLRSQPHVIQSGESTSKMVADQTGVAKTGSIEITDAENNTYTIKIPRRVSTRSDHSNEWVSVKLCANTIALFNNGYKVKLLR